jgi:hypothetical protein
MKEKLQYTQLSLHGSLLNLPNHAFRFLETSKLAKLPSKFEFLLHHSFDNIAWSLAVTYRTGKDSIIWQ